MASIFAGLDASAAQSRSASEVRPINPSGPARRRWRSWSTIGAIVAVAALAANTMLATGRDRPLERAVPATPAARLATAASPITPPPLMVMAQEPEPPAPMVEPTAAPPRPATARPASAKRKKSRLSAPARRVRVAQVTHHPVPRNCEGTIRMERARCMYPEVVAADDLLRDAYADAVRAGVANRTLNRYRHRWERLRGQALTQPDRVARGFRELARDLQELGADTDDGSVGRIAGAY
ncbi:hypothetical protein [Sphingomonas quercus]|uniref:Uncharacterized protein n=1 Tax=Sphingomonas quercus TaxID=2842451 RepID=A0ABS6BHR1_9SPHN|nr:hypothetical protein [Sphingomonas quercus]MBU3077336.1 hypothetical protein [Sphingomonas quercus]